jgi:hypothetical protein
MAQMAISSIKDSALENISILEDVVDFKIKIYPRA